METPMTTEATTGITTQNIVELINSFATIVGIMAIGLTLIGVIAVWRTPKDGAWAFFSKQQSAAAPHSDISSELSRLP